ncbi:hypothetical protein GCM10010508_51500 [Streptomyces naganishii JCM 4654]|uniref:Uncharacterized protein n=1 Tax=Streptomyces naganishii JCM 4654 TaxID=1306179 RepID=A0A918Y8G9_9ACTN|nr:hypothetical protein GCM10010508_51500 [Streptomyces naganishii JCM 4654]
MTLADAIVPLNTGLPTAGSREARARWATPLWEAPRGARAAYGDAMELGWCSRGAVPLEVQLCRMRGLTEPRLCRNQTPQGNSEVRVKAHISFGPRVFLKPPHAKAPPG